MQQLYHLTRRYGPLFIVIAAFLWSLDGVIRVKSLYALAPLATVFWEHALGLAIIAPFFWTKRHEIQKLTPSDWRFILLISLFAGTLGTVFYTYALTQTNFANYSIVVLVQQTQPIWAIALARLVLREPLRRNFLAYAGFALVGVYLLTFPRLVPNFDTGSGTGIAGLLALCAAMSWGSATVWGKRVLGRVSFMTASFLRFFLAAVFSFTLFLCFSLVQSLFGLDGVLGRSYESSRIFQLTFEQLRGLVMIVLVSGASAMLLYYAGLKHTPARVSTICELAWPASALIIGILVFKNSFTILQIFGVVLLVASMVAISLTQKDGPPEQCQTALKNG
jgi:drug/metabolite transporter (DMT)-like permease